MEGVVRIAILGVTLLLFVFSTGFAAADEGETQEKEVSITGIVTENFQIVTDKEEIFEIGDTTEGDEVVRMVGEKVKVKGTVTTYGETRFIAIESYEVAQ